MEIFKPGWSQYEIRLGFQPPREQLQKLQSSPKFFNGTDKSLSTASTYELGKGHIFTFFPARLMRFNEMNYHIKFTLLS